MERAAPNALNRELPESPHSLRWPRWLLPGSKGMSMPPRAELAGSGEWAPWPSACWDLRPLAEAQTRRFIADLGKKTYPGQRCDAWGTREDRLDGDGFRCMWSASEGGDGLPAVSSQPKCAALMYSRLSHQDKIEFFSLDRVSIVIASADEADCHQSSRISTLLDHATDSI